MSSHVTVQSYVHDLSAEDLRALAQHIADVTENTITFSPNSQRDELRRDLKLVLKNREDIRKTIPELAHTCPSLPHLETEVTEQQIKNVSEGLQIDLQDVAAALPTGGSLVWRDPPSVLPDTPLWDTSLKPDLSNLASTAPVSTTTNTVTPRTLTTFSAVTSTSAITTTTVASAVDWFASSSTFRPIPTPVFSAARGFESAPLGAGATSRVASVLTTANVSVNPATSAQQTAFVTQLLNSNAELVHQVRALQEQLAHQRQVLLPSPSPPQSPTPGGTRPKSTGKDSLVIRFTKEARQRKLFFNGSPDESAREFLRKLEYLRKMMDMPDSDITLAFPDLLGGAAERWYQVQDEFHSWDELRQRFSLAYIRKNEDAILINKIVNRTQVAAERPVHFIATMERLNKMLDRPWPDSTLISIIINNLLPCYQEKIGCLYTPTTIRALETMCLHLEDTMRASKNFKPPSADLLQDPDVGLPGGVTIKDTAIKTKLEGHRLAAVASAPIQPAVTATEASPISDGLLHYQIDAFTPGCWNCQQSGHFHAACPATPKKLFCIFCGKPGVKSIDCCRKRFFRPSSTPAARPPAPPPPVLTEEMYTRISKMVTDAVAAAMKNSKN